MTLIRRGGASPAYHLVRISVMLAALALLVFGRDRLAPGGGTSLDRWVATVFAVLLPIFVVLEMRLKPFTRIALLRHATATPMARGGIGALLSLYAIAILAPVLAPYAPEAQDLANKSFLAPGSDHWFGTDKFGRDLWSRVLYGSRISLTIGFVSVTLSISIGTVVGLLAGYLRGAVDIVLMRFADLLLAFPRLILLLALIALFQPSIYMLVAVLGLTGWMGTARLIRSETLSLREREFVLAAQGFGFGTRRILSRHILPNVMAPIVIAATLGVGNTILVEAALSFLGLGVQPPAPSWGNLVRDGQDVLLQAWWVATLPGLAIVLTVLAFNLVGDGLRDALDPRSRPGSSIR